MVGSKKNLQTEASPDIKIPNFRVSKSGLATPSSSRGRSPQIKKYIKPIPKSKFKLLMNHNNNSELSDLQHRI
jgi:hypothetical protein